MLSVEINYMKNKSWSLLITFQFLLTNASMTILMKN